MISHTRCTRRSPTATMMARCVAGILCALGILLAAPRPAAAQIPVPPIVERDTQGWGLVSDISVLVGVTSVALTPRAYHDEREAPHGWRSRWHISGLAPAMSMAGLTLLLELPIKRGLTSTRPGCSVEDTIVSAPGSNCETFGGPSTHAFATWGAMGVGTGVFLVDTLKYSGGRVNAGALAGDIFVPLIAAMATSIGRGIDLNQADVRDLNGDRIAVDPQPFESSGQIAAGAVHGLLGGLTLGVAYAILRPPSCSSSGAMLCW